ncbi:hypothetical protein GYMLUDRAFT_181064 [Collybiopsis luxurians FD-317 M1]|uniref:Uncharacterized protein n=1 Tax=Collybiopsis luxurians FD-317 M1 TaxID=944289 RepID=A0A0D0BBH4_9AGAR|nr:hypothetical protein GYMLUDRAFT_181064 [Collybiopsis luxurians FD-317 M1]
MASFSMAAYIDRLLDKRGFKNLSPKATPFLPGLSLSLTQSPKTDNEKEFMRNKPYPNLSVLCNSCKPPVVLRLPKPQLCSVNSQKIPGCAHWNAFIHLLRYLARTKEYGITFQ